MSIVYDHHHEFIDLVCQGPYGLSSRGSVDMLSRVRHLSALEISYALSDTRQAHNVVGHTFGGNMFYSRVTCNGEKAQRTGCPAVLMMRGPHQPYMPDEAGAVGILISAVPRSEEWPAFENVFISQTKDFGRQQHESDWQYAGRYELADTHALSVDEVALLPDEVRVLCLPASRWLMRS